MHDTAGSHPDIHWPSGFSPADAHSFHRGQAVVPGPPERAFRLLTDVPNWPTWIPHCEEVTTTTPAQSFEARWHGYRFEVFVGEQVSPRRVGWLGIGAGVQLYQTWLLTEVPDGTHAVVESAVRTARAQVPRPPVPGLGPAPGRPVARPAREALAGAAGPRSDVMTRRAAFRSGPGQLENHRHDRLGAARQPVQADHAVHLLAIRHV
ncbi:SRPBCC family protein [Streptomyces sp. NPDC001276]|uniref:SRPBCC family protein n=1 Tax=Streptomyces sp. NPDC001276 TaxID=3364555 RepID=UPI00368F1709